MNLETMTFADLLALYNSMSEKQAGPKTFASRARLIERIGKMALAKDIDLASFRQPEPTEVTVRDTEQQTEVVEASEAPKETEPKRGRGVGELARLMLMDPMGYPYALIAGMVNAEIAGATASPKSIAWYASKMRKAGIDVPQRKKAFSANMDEKETAEWLKGVRVVESRVDR